MEIFIKIILIHIAAVSSPGPDFALVVNYSLKKGMKSAMIVSCGIGTGLIFHITYSLFGLGILIEKYPLINSMFKYLGCLYIIYIGFMITFSSWKTRGKIVLESKKYEINSPFLVGLWTNILNFKASLYFVSIFSPILVVDTVKLTEKYILSFLIILITILWFWLISFIFSRNFARKQYEKRAYLIDCALGTMMVMIGVSLLVGQYSS
ncbi:MAG: LysE family transporter [Halobacteriovoraceae bacterium]|nr:LysE family transporter [Halobacteriovoraceae bacterium]